MASRIPSEWRTVDYYAELGVSSDATFDDVSRRYRALAKEIHPDVRPGDAAAAARFVRVSSAHEVLADPARRHDYDVYRRSLRDPIGPREPRLRIVDDPPSGRRGSYARTPRPSGPRGSSPRRSGSRPARTNRGPFSFIGEFASSHPIAFAVVIALVVIVIAASLST